MAKPTRAVSIKRFVSILMFIVAVVAFVWRLLAPDILDSWGFSNVIYLLLVLSFLPLVTVIGWFGAQLTFPIEID